MQNLAKKARQFNPPLKEKYSKSDDPKEETEAKKALAHFVTDLNGAIYAATSLVPELFAALLKARYSRTQLSAKQLLWREFVFQKINIDWQKIDAARQILDEVLNYKKAEGVAERILLQYGDDSVFELGGAHLFLDRVSMVASKVIEDARIGLSPLEKSTRYVIFDQKDSSGDYLFFKDPKLMESKYKNLFLNVTRDCFNLYTEAVAIFLDYYQKQMPLKNEKFPDLVSGHLTVYKKLTDEKSIKAAQIAYNASIRAKACDIARSLLPASTLTNIGEFGNARAYGYLFTKMLSSPMAEIQMIASEGVRELKKVLPKFFDIVDNSYGQAYQQYLIKTDQALGRRAKELLAVVKPEAATRVELIEMDQDPEINIAAALLYPYCNLPLKQIIKIVRGLSKSKRGEILHDSLKFRTNRRHKPPRAYEIAGYELVFDILGNFGIYRDLHRQRTLTQQRQNITSEHGFDMPLEFKGLGLDSEFVELMTKMKNAHHQVELDFPSEAQYLTTMANYTRWYMGMNLREAFWLTELRSVPQGHFSYRSIAQEMFIKSQQRYPFLKTLKPGKNHFVDMSDRSKNLERMEAQQRIQVKLSQIEEKYS